MTRPPIRFDDGAAYERLMGAWTQSAGQIFLDWLSPAAGQKWLDVGCGNGAFTELIVQRHAPSEARGIDPSAGQIAFAQSRPGAAGAIFQQGDAMDLPFEDRRFDAATMALVISFVPDPAKGVREMTRVVRPGGVVAAYMWDQPGGGSPNEAFIIELRALGVTPALPVSSAVSRAEALRELWADAGLAAIETRVIEVRRAFENFDDFWQANTETGVMRANLASLSADMAATWKERIRARLPADDQGRIEYGSFANAVKGLVPRS